MEYIQHKYYVKSITYQNYPLSNKDAMPRLIRWILLLREFNITIKDKKWVENVVVDHLSRLTFNKSMDAFPIRDLFPDEQLFSISTLPRYANIVNFLVTGKTPSHWCAQDKKRLVVEKHNFSTMVFIYFSTVHTK